MHGRSDVGPADRAARLVRVLRRRGRRLLERGQGCAGRGRSGLDRAVRRGVDRGGGGARLRRRVAVRRGLRDRDHRDRRAPTAARRTSRSARSASRSACAMARATHDAGCSCRGTGRTSASGRPRSPCTCSGGCSWMLPVPVPVPVRAVRCRGPGLARRARVSARLFVALELPAECAGCVGAVAGAGLRGRCRVCVWSVLRTCTRRSCFLGSRPEEEIEAIGAACGVVAGEPVADSGLGSALWLPARRPRVLAVRAVRSRTARLGGSSPRCRTRWWPAVGTRRSRGRFSPT